jgi:DNA-binding MarR family transcriptional regulator/ribosomal protein S18 acetylase RimI-like enzyme
MAVTAVQTRVVRAFGREFAAAGGLLSPDYLESGLSLGEARCLYELGQVGEITPSTLADVLGLDLGYVSRVLKRLVQGRLVSKRRGADGRTRFVELTRAGRRRLTALGRRMDHRLASWLRSRPSDSVDDLARGMGAFLDGDAASEVIVRDRRPGDAGRIIARHGELYVEEFGYPASFEAYVIDAFASLLKRFTAPADRLLVAERANRFAGSVAVKELSRTTYQLRFLLVEPAARGSGLGRRLVQMVVDHARERNARRVVLDTASDLRSARGLYEAVGFRRTKSAAGAARLPQGTRSEHWELQLTRG